jgi:hypothetical protein
VVDKVHIGFYERYIVELNSVFFTEFYHQLLNFSEVVTGDSREEVMNTLELETTVEPVHPWGAVNILSSSKL